MQDDSRKTYEPVVPSIADPDPISGAFWNPESGIGIKSGSGSGMNNQNHITESLETIFQS